MAAGGVGSFCDNARKYSQGLQCVAAATRYRKEHLDTVSEARASFASARWRRTSGRYCSDDRLLDPGLAGKPVVIGPTVRTKSIAEKHDASQESLTIGFDASRNRAAGLRTLDHDHAHTSLPETRICRAKGPAGWSALSSVRVTWGASHLGSLFEQRAACS